jgi:hypothetical protein
MAWTYTTLKQAIQDYIEVEDEDTLTDNLDVIILQAEDRILKNVQIPDFRKNASATMTEDSEYLSTPVDFLSSYSLSVDTSSGTEFLLFKEVNYLRAVYPDSTEAGVPRFYAIWDEDYFIIAPTPDGAYEAELHYFYRPESITTATSGTSWVGTNAESTLLSACLLEAYIFLKGEADMIQTYEARYKEALNELKFVGEWRDKADQFRTNQ